MIVVDTNILASFAMDGEDGARVHQQDSEWAAPTIAVSELRNTLLGFIRRDGTPLNEALEANADALATLGDRIHSLDGAAVLEAALECGLTAYDAEFVVCARTLGVRLVTLDRAILRGAPDVAVSPTAFTQP